MCSDPGAGSFFFVVHIDPLAIRSKNSTPRPTPSCPSPSRSGINVPKMHAEALRSEAVAWLPTRV